MTIGIIKKNYERGLWNAQQLETAVLAGAITQEQADAIIAGAQVPGDAAAIDEALTILRGDEGSAVASVLADVQKQELAAMRRALDGYVLEIAETPALVNENLLILREWKAGTADAPITYTQDVDVRMHNEIPYMCALTHTHNGEPDWSPDLAPSLWKEYHGTSIETARAYRAPSGEHDMYRAGEYMVWTDGLIYRCLTDTDRGPNILPDSWEVTT